MLFVCNFIIENYERVEHWWVASIKCRSLLLQTSETVPKLCTITSSHLVVSLSPHKDWEKLYICNDTKAPADTAPFDAMSMSKCDKLYCRCCEKKTLLISPHTSPMVQPNNRNHHRNCFIYLLCLYLWQDFRTIMCCIWAKTTTVRAWFWWWSYGSCEYNLETGTNKIKTEIR